MILIDGNTLSLEAMRDVACGAEVGVADGVRERVEASRRVVDRILSTDEPVYGINTGFGKLSDVRIRPSRRGSSSSTPCTSTRRTPP